MNSSRKRSLLPYVPGYDDNAALKLVFYLAGAYIMLGLTWAVMMIVNTTATAYDTYIYPNISLPQVSMFGSKWWTIFTYFLFHVPNSFMHMLSNMLWLYTFSAVVQMLVGKKQVFALFIYSAIVGGLVYMLAQLIPGAQTAAHLVGPHAGIVGMATAAYVLAPKYRFYFSDTFSLPIALVAGVFAVLMILSSGFTIPVLLLMVGGGLMGWGYVALLRAGYRPGAWAYDVSGRVERMFTPANNKNKKRMPLPTNNNKKGNIDERRIDEILDKINLKGYQSLSREEKEILQQAGKK